MSFETNGSAKSIDLAVQTESKTALRRKIIGLRTENQHLRKQVAEMNNRIVEFEAELKQYKNAHTPSRKKGAAGRGGDHNGPDDSGFREVCNEYNYRDSVVAHLTRPRTPVSDGTSQIRPKRDCTDSQEHYSTRDVATARTSVTGIPVGRWVLGGIILRRDGW